jgi:hypothetical protein
MELINQDILVILNKINLKEKVSLFSHKELIRAILKVEKWMEKEFLNLKMGIFLMGNIKIIKNTGLVNILNVVKFFKGDGQME